jgi:hypothetical protein
MPAEVEIAAGLNLGDGLLQVVFAEFRQPACGGAADGLNGLRLADSQKANRIPLAAVFIGGSAYLLQHLCYIGLDGYRAHAAMINELSPQASFRARKFRQSSG